MTCAPGHRGRGRLLAARPGDDPGRARHDPGPQAGALRPLPGRGDDLAGRAVRGPGRAVPVRGADHRLHRRDLDAVPVRADAGRGRRRRLAGRDDQGPAGRWPCWPASASGRCWSSRWATRSSARRSGWTAANSEYGGNIQGIAALVFNRYVFAFEATSALLITAAVGAMVLAHRERLVPRRGQADLAARADAPLRRDRRAPRTAADARASSPGTTRWTPRRCCPTARVVRALGVGHPAGPRHDPGQPGPGRPDRQTVGDRGPDARGRRRAATSSRNASQTRAVQPATEGTSREPGQLHRAVGDPVHHRRGRLHDRGATPSSPSCASS